MFKYLLIVENNLKSVFSYHLSSKYGYKEQDYLNPKNFTRDMKEARRVDDVLSKMKRQIRILLIRQEYIILKEEKSFL